MTIPAGTYGGATLTAAQTAVAGQVFAVAYTLPLPPAQQDRAALAALMTAWVESRFSNPPLGAGDKDSVGVMQQRLDYWAGVPDVRGDVTGATRQFLTGVQTPRHTGRTQGLTNLAGWTSGDLGGWCQAVQHSGFPLRYAQEKAVSDAVFAALKGLTMVHVFQDCQLELVVNRGGGNRNPTLGLVLHITAGRASDEFGWFNNPTAQASSTWYVDYDPAISTKQYIDPDTEHAWAQAAGNRDYHSVETEGMPGEVMNANQIERVAKLYAEGHKRYGWPFKLANKPGEPGLGYHAMGGAAWGGHPCPLPPRIAQRQAVLDRAQVLAGGAPTPKPTPTPTPAPAPAPHPAPTPAPKPTPAPVAHAPRFPLPAGYYFGPKSGPAQSVSGWYSHAADLSAWQREMAHRGWKISVTGRYDTVTAAVVKAFQTEKGLRPVDSLIGPETWAAAWTAPVTR